MSFLQISFDHVIFFFSLVKVHLISTDTISRDMCYGIITGSNGAL